MMVWTSNGVDANGSLADCGVGLTAFQNQYPELVSPDSTTTEADLIPDEEIKIWPNPATDYIYFSRTDYSEMLARVYDLSGRMVLESEIEPADESALDIRLLLPGVYILFLHSERELSRMNLVVQ